MSMISRYKKPGGFVQLLNLIETCGPAKQEKFLKIIEEENRHWADAIRKKMLSMDRILTWDDSTLGEIAVRLPKLALATALKGLPEDKQARFTATFSHSQRRQLDDALGGKDPSDNEISATFVRILQETRSMMSEGYIRVEKVDPDLVIEDEIEEELEKVQDGFSLSADGGSDTPKSESQMAKELSLPADGDANFDLTKVKQKLFQLNRENQELKKENRKMREKLEQIKKIA